MKSNISVIIITKDAEKYLPECLDSLERFDEVIVLDNGSTDNTMQIARKFKNVKLFKHEFIGFGPLKNIAADYASNDWVLSIDSDEVFPEVLVREILDISLDINNTYSIVRDNYYGGELVLCCGWENDQVVRLFNKKVTRFNSNLVHESVIVDDISKVVNLRNRFKHYSFDSISQLISKMDQYSDLWARSQDSSKNSSPLIAIIKGFVSFIKFYFFKKGFLCGYKGIVISVSNAGGVFYKYMKLYESRKQNKL